MTDEATPQPAPEATPAPAPEPISADTVVSQPEAVPAAPDSSILSNKIDQLLSREESIQQRRSQEAEYAKMKEELNTLRNLVGPDFQQRYNEMSQRVERSDDDQSQLMKNLQVELDQMKHSQDVLQRQLKEREQQNEYAEAAQEVATWVSANEEHFPLLNKINQQPLVFQKMWNTKRETGHMISETQAARDIEQELSQIVEQLAPLLGFQKSEERAEREEPISTTTAGLSISDPLDREEMTEDERMRWLIEQYS